MKQEPKEIWEEEFDERFVDKGTPRLEVEEPYKIGNRNYTGEHYILPGHKIREGQSPAEIKRFFTHLLNQERLECMKKLPPERIIHEYMPSQNTGENRGWNDYRNAAIKALNPKEQ